jgi:hypothetical protein
VESLDNENKQLHEEVTELKQLVFEIKNQENIHLQNPADCPNLQSEIKTLQDELKSQQALFKQETETQQQTLNSWVEVVQKENNLLSSSRWRGDTSKTQRGTSSSYSRT